VELVTDLQIFAHVDTVLEDIRQRESKLSALSARE
jgi:hypothetical protein